LRKIFPNSRKYFSPAKGFFIVTPYPDGFSRNSIFSIKMLVMPSPGLYNWAECNEFDESPEN
jgi:hypothetical protein